MTDLTQRTRRPTEAEIARVEHLRSQGRGQYAISACTGLTEAQVHQALTIGGVNRSLRRQAKPGLDDRRVMRLKQVVELPEQVWYWYFECRGFLIRWETHTDDVIRLRQTFDAFEESPRADTDDLIGLGVVGVFHEGVLSSILPQDPPDF